MSQKILSDFDDFGTNCSGFGEALLKKLLDSKEQKPNII